MLFFPIANELTVTAEQFVLKLNCVVFWNYGNHCVIFSISSFLSYLKTKVCEVNETEKLFADCFQTLCRNATDIKYWCFHFFQKRSNWYLFLDSLFFTEQPIKLELFGVKFSFDIAWTSFNHVAKFLRKDRITKRLEPRLIWDFLMAEPSLPLGRYLTTGRYWSLFGRYYFSGLYFCK